MSAADEEVRALQTALAGVHAAIWGYGRLTPSLPDESMDDARSAYRRYRELRGRLGDMLAERKAEPIASEPGYRLPHDVDDAASARKLAAHLEHGCARVFGVLVAGARGAELRRFAADRVLECARRQRGWGGRPGALPGAGKLGPG